MQGAENLKKHLSSTTFDRYFTHSSRDGEKVSNDELHSYLVVFESPV
jgi:hypothetical protein